MAQKIVRISYWNGTKEGKGRRYTQFFANVDCVT